MIDNAVLISGVGQRVGLHLARSFANRNVAVIGTYRTPRNSLTELSDQGVDLVACDFSRARDLDDLIEHVGERYSSLRALIHNASDWGAESDATNPGSLMQRMMDVHVNAPYRLNLALSGLLEACTHDYADIIHIGDYVSSRGSKKHIAYAASKAAQDNLTLSFATKFAPRIKVNSLAPALIMFNDSDGEDYRKKALAKSLLQREGGLDEVIHQIDYLLDSQYVTGRIIAMDGGRHLK